MDLFSGFLWVDKSISVMQRWFPEIFTLQNTTLFDSWILVENLIDTCKQPIVGNVPPGYSNNLYAWTTRTRMGSSEWESARLKIQVSTCLSDYLSQVPPSFWKRGILVVILLPRTVCKHRAVDKRVIFPFYCWQRGQTSSSSSWSSLLLGLSWWWQASHSRGQKKLLWYNLLTWEQTNDPAVWQPINGAD